MLLANQTAKYIFLDKNQTEELNFKVLNNKVDLFLPDFYIILDTNSKILPISNITISVN
jgi:hypothetical protein